jgi:2-alkyl-3-oxoalkanoate reductase
VSTALVTGATGLVGSHIIERLLNDGWSVRALVRSPAAGAALPEPVELRIGDVLDASSFASAARGAHVIFHTAANIIVRGGWESYQSTNIDGTRNALEAARQAGARLLHVSSVAVYGAAARYEAVRRGALTDELTPLAPLPERAFYARSKRESEALVLEAHARGVAWTTAVRPDVIYGRRDRQFVPRMATVLRKGIPLPLIHGGQPILPVVHAANVADGAVLAATSDVAGGKAYNLANDFEVSVRRFFELAGQGLGRPVRFVPLPLWLARPGLRVVKGAARLVSGGRFTLVSNSAMEFLAEGNPFTSERARHELGWAPGVRPEVGVPDAFAWWAATHQEKQRGAT